MKYAVALALVLVAVWLVVFHPIILALLAAGSVGAFLGARFGGNKLTRLPNIR